MNEKMSFEEKLSIIIDSIEYFEEEFKTSFTKDNLSDNNFSLVNEDKIKIRNEIFSEIVELFDYNNLPIVLDEDEYFKLEPFKTDFETELENKELFVASKDFFHNYNLVYSRKYYKGIYKFSNGIVCSPNLDEIKKYADEVKNNNLYFSADINLKQEEFNNLCYTLPIKIPNAKVVKDTDLMYIIDCLFKEKKVSMKNLPREKQLLNFINSLYSNEMKTKLEFMFRNDLGKLAIILGYDAIYISKDFLLYFQILNRKKICVSENNYQKAEYQLIFKDTDFK